MDNQFETQGNEQKADVQQAPTKPIGENKPAKTLPEAASPLALPKRVSKAPYVVMCISLVGAYFLPLATYVCFIVLLVMFIRSRMKKRPFPMLAGILTLLALVGAIINSAVAYSQYTQYLLS